MTRATAILFLTLSVSFFTGTALAETVAEQTRGTLNAYVKEYNLSTFYHDSMSGLEVFKATEVLATSSGRPTQLSVEFTPQGIQYQLQYTEQALKHPEFLAADLINIEALRYRWDHGGVYLASETRYNAQLGHSDALYRLALQDGMFLGNSKYISKITNVLGGEDPVRRARVEAEVRRILEVTVASQKELLPIAEQYNKDQRKALEKYRRDSQALERFEAMEEKLNDLLLKNDRKGVRQMLEAYLPWPVMEPMETQAWKTWLQAIEFPDFKNTVTAVRGLDFITDKVQRLKLPNGEERVAFMSTVLTKNQGSYTRRLRSLTTNREATGRLAENVPGVQLTKQMSSHSIQPRASNFLSFTYDAVTAMKFMGADTVAKNGQSIPGGGLLAVRMDARRLFPNLISGFHGEVELLAALVVFPDEVVNYREGRFPTYESQQDFFKAVQEKTGVDFLKNRTSRDPLYVEGGRRFFHELTRQRLESGAGQCRGVFLAH